MPKIKVLLKLQVIAQKSVLSWLLKCLNKYQGPKPRQIQQQYVTSLLSGNMCQQLLSMGLKTNKLHIDLYNKCFLIELFCNDKTLCIDMSDGGTLVIEELFKLYRTLLPCLPVGAVRFGINCDVKAGVDQRYVKDVNSFFYRILGQMNNLCYVVMKGVGDTEILRQLGLNCDNLEHVDVSDSWRVSDWSVAHLLFEDPRVFNDKNLEELIMADADINMCCRKLKFFGLKGTDVTTKSIAMCLSFCPRITLFGGYIYQGSFLEALEKVSSLKDRRKFFLKDFYEDKITESNSLFLSSVCPYIDYLSTSGCSLPCLYNLNSLISLTLDCDFQCWEEELYSYFLSHGSCLKSLVLNDSQNCKLDIGWLMELTPSLVSLTAYVHYSGIGYPVTWENLENANITVDCSKCFYELLTHAPNIKNLTLKFQEEPYMESCLCINDDLILDITTSGGLLNARRITIGECNLGVVALRALIIYALDLEYVSTLSLWKNLTKEDLIEIEKEGLSSNWDIELKYY